MNEAWAKANGALETQDATSKTENGATRAVNGTGASRWPAVRSTAAP